MPEASKECECHTYWFFRFLLWSHMHRVHTGATVVLYTYICIMYVGQTLLYRIRFNFRGVKLLRFSRISSHPWRFHPTKTYTRLYFSCLRLCNRKNTKTREPWKFNSAKVKAYMVLKTTETSEQPTSWRHSAGQVSRPSAVVRSRTTGTKVLPNFSSYIRISVTHSLPVWAKTVAK